MRRTSSATTWGSRATRETASPRRRFWSRANLGVNCVPLPGNVTTGFPSPAACSLPVPARPMTMSARESKSPKAPWTHTTWSHVSPASSGCLRRCLQGRRQALASRLPVQPGPVAPPRATERPTSETRALRPNLPKPRRPARGPGRCRTRPGGCPGNNPTTRKSGRSPKSLPWIGKRVHHHVADKLRRHLPAGHRLSRQQIASVDVDGIPAHQGVFPKVVPPDVLRLSRRDKEGTPPARNLPANQRRVNIADSDDAVDGRRSSA